MLDTKSTVCRGAIITVNAVHHGRQDIRWLRQSRCVENRSFLKCINSISEQQGTLGRWCAFFDELRKAVLNSSTPEQTLTRSRRASPCWNPSTRRRATSSCVFVSPFCLSTSRKRAVRQLLLLLLLRRRSGGQSSPPLCRNCVFHPF